MPTAIQQVHRLAVHDAAIGVVDGNLIPVVVTLGFHVQHVCECQLVDIIVLADLQAFLDLGLEFLWEQNLINELRRQVVVGIGKREDTVVGHLVQLLRADLTALADLLQPVLPDAVQIGSALLTVVVAHARQGVALHIALIFTHLSSQILHTDLVVESLHVFALAAETLEVDLTFCVQIHLVGHGYHVVVGLHILVGVGHDPLAALLEVLQGVAQLLGSGGSVELGRSTF